MRIGVPREVKDSESRIGLTPKGARTLTSCGHEIVVENGAGSGAGFSDADFVEAGARIGSAADAWGGDLVIKVKEPLPSEYGLLRDNILLTFLHLAGSDPALTDALLRARTTAIAYETIKDENGRLPLLAPMSAIAGSMAPIVGAAHLAAFRGGRGVLLAEILGRSSGRVVIIGDGVVGRHAAHVAIGLGTEVTVFGLDQANVAGLPQFGQRLEFVQSSPERVAERLVDADLVIGAVLLHGARTPWVVTEGMVETMQRGAVIVDVAIDQGGCVETSRPTSHSDPVYTKHSVVHYCVTNMPGAYPRTATLALTEATLPYIERIADRGIEAVRQDEGFAAGINVEAGRIVHAAVAAAFDAR
ncbi:MAG: alanine dehydrogenase [Gammaproteobacteria bacterium]|nr:alanine dehydrogenase [Gammaproteobacteria bacterium]